MDVLVDTSIWSLALRRRPDALSAQQRQLRDGLAELVREGRVALIGPIRQELLSGIREVTAFQQLRDRLRAFEDVPLVCEDYEEAARFTNQCRAAGVAGSPIDFVICAAAVRRGFAIFTTDADFQRYADHIPLRLYRPEHETTSV